MEIVLKLYALRSFFFKTGWNIMGKETVFRGAIIIFYKNFISIGYVVNKMEVRCFSGPQSSGQGYSAVLRSMLQILLSLTLFILKRIHIVVVIVFFSSLFANRKGFNYIILNGVDM